MPSRAGSLSNQTLNQSFTEASNEHHFPIKNNKTVFQIIFHLGDRSLSDYKLESESLDLTSDPSNHSVAVVSLVLRRRTQFHSVTAFAQTMFVLLAAVATFFFDREDFSDRILVSAVLLLVLATISSSVHTVGNWSE
jgi:hypothetical protein